MKGEIKIEFKANIEKDKQGFIARILSLGIYGVGDTQAQAIKSLKVSIDIIMEHCLEDGTLNEVLKNAGFSKKIKAIRKPIKTKDIAVDYSFPFKKYYEQRQYA